jgi:hypothetical protein
MTRLVVVRGAMAFNRSILRQLVVVRLFFGIGVGDASLKDILLLQKQIISFGTLAAVLAIYLKN